MDNQGFIFLHRKLSESDLWLGERFTKGQAWVDLLMLANHEKHSFFIRGNEVMIEQGQVGWSEESLGLRWKWSRNRVRAFKLWLKRYNRIDIKNDRVLGVITILNYKQYQYKVQQKVQQTIQQKVQQKDTNNNDNNVNKNISNTTNMVKDQYGNKYVNFVLDEFKKNTGLSPIDSNARQVAFNIYQITSSFIRKYGELYKEKRGTEMKFSEIVTKAWQVYRENNGGHLPQRMKTFKEHYKGMLESLSISLTKG